MEVLRLHEFGNEFVALLRLAPDTQFTAHTHPGGEEIFVLNGRFCDEFGTYSQGSWMRNPDPGTHTPFTEEDGALIYFKAGHL